MSDKFEYNYEAPTIKEREEVLNIKKQYLPQEENTSKVEQLKKIDQKVKNIPVIVSLSLGIIGTLLFGVSMCFFLEWTNIKYYGIPFEIIGIIMIILAYPIHKKVTNKMKQKYSKQILELADEILNEQK